LLDDELAPAVSITASSNSAIKQLREHIFGPLHFTDNTLSECFNYVHKVISESSKSPNAANYQSENSRTMANVM